MKIRIPSLPPRAQAAFDRYLDWVNVAIWSRGRFELRRIDIVLALGGIVCVGWYTYTSGWQGAILGAAMYVMVAMISLWML
jgi:hypothetical protein